MTNYDYRAFNGKDAPEWATPEQVELFCSMLNADIPTALSKRGVRYKVLSRYPSGRLYFYLLGAHITGGES